MSRHCRIISPFGFAIISDSRLAHASRSNNPFSLVRGIGILPVSPGHKRDAYATSLLPSVSPSEQPRPPCFTKPAQLTSPHAHAAPGIVVRFVRQVVTSVSDVQGQLRDGIPAAIPRATFRGALCVYDNLPGQSCLLPGQRIVTEADDICHLIAAEMLPVDGKNARVIGEDDDKLSPLAIGSQSLHLAHQEAGQLLQRLRRDVQVLLPVRDQDLHLSGRARGRGACWLV